MIQIANPIYDSVFKYLMQDERAAKCLLSAVLDQKIELLEVLPQERLISSSERSDLSVIRFDYRATIREENGNLKKILIELQKIKRLTDVERFRRYLGENYSVQDTVNGQTLSLPITTIYLLGFELDVRSPVIRVGRQYIDPVSKEVVEGTDAFIEALTHDAYFVQIPLLPTKHQSRIERVLTVFSQQWRTDALPESRFYLQLPDELKNEDNSPLVERLSIAVADPQIKRNAVEEESFDKVLRRELGQEYTKGKEEGAHQKALDTARQMKEDGLAVAKIKQYTGLSESDIEAL